MERGCASIIANGNDRRSLARFYLYHPPFSSTRKRARRTSRREFFDRSNSPPRGPSGSDANGSHYAFPSFPRDDDTGQQCGNRLPDAGARYRLSHADDFFFFFFFFFLLCVGRLVSFALNWSRSRRALVTRSGKPACRPTDNIDHPYGVSHKVCIKLQERISRVERTASRAGSLRLSCKIQRNG